MTIEGEKVQAFSAITLTLPPQAEDFSQMIIDHSRSMYAISRESVERLVGERYLSPADLAKQLAMASKASQSPTETPPTPVPTSSQHHDPTDTLAHAALRGSEVVEVVPAKPKRHRTRRRKHNRPDGTQPMYSNDNAANKLNDREQVIKLR
jgi:hypothetical protein